MPVRFNKQQSKVLNDYAKKVAKGETTLLRAVWDSRMECGIWETVRTAGESFPVIKRAIKRRVAKIEKIEKKRI